MRAMSSSTRSWDRDRQRLAAVRTGRHYIGFDTDEGYVAVAERRIAEERAALEARSSGTRAGRFGVELPGRPNVRG